MRYKKLGSLGLLTAAATALLLTGSGCSPLSQEELNRLVKEDAEFARMITARDQVNGQVHLIRQDLLNRKKILNAQVEKIRTEYDAYARVQNQKIEQYRSTIRANRQLLKQEIEKAQAELAAKTTECSGYQKTLA
ncbi:MAG: hypothetical protein WCG06_05465, partial [Candidatus Omnitrophota bacterium]